MDRVMVGGTLPRMGSWFHKKEQARRNKPVSGPSPRSLMQVLPPLTINWDVEV